MTHTIIAGIQVVPKGNNIKAEEVMKKVLSVIEQSGLHSKEENFEVVIEGSYEQVTRVIEAVQLASFNAGAEELLLNIRMQIIKGKDVKLKSHKAI
jgi:uncharacterized protein YqgV (UPF0045/DUF77 family)